MKILKSKLFEKFELKNEESSLVCGGLVTSMDSDTNATNGYDVTYDTLDGSGESLGMDTVLTSTTDRDKPSDCGNSY